jgi:hypothetical protein
VIKFLLVLTSVNMIEISDNAFSFLSRIPLLLTSSQIIPVRVPVAPLFTTFCCTTAVLSTVTEFVTVTFIILQLHMESTNPDCRSTFTLYSPVGKFAMVHLPFVVVVLATVFPMLSMTFIVVPCKVVSISSCTPFILVSCQISPVNVPVVT